MEDAGISAPLLPTYLPEEYRQDELTEDQNQAFWSAAYQSENDLFIQIQVQKGQNGAWTMLQKDEATPECYVWDGIEFYIMTNMGKSVATWSNEQYTYLISASNQAEIYKMIESVCKEDSQ